MFPLALGGEWSMIDDDASWWPAAWLRAGEESP